MKFKADKVRIYFNKAEDFPRIWSLDFGIDTVEICCSFIHIRTKKVGQTNHNIEVKYPNPKAWIEYYDVLVNIYKDCSIGITDVVD